ncbi:DNA-binding protein [Nocardia vulneris]|uniref:DNA-binding protein n=2 Tax=Nocardia vulneris TaxID=1141657 RepID=A0ABR4ZEP5_9NOCA|nr:DNA-binding protein [Nocardia vulneris]
MVTGPNTALRAARMGRLMSQDDLARALRAIGCTSANKRLVQRWESGTTRTPRPSHASALERVLGMPIEHLGFVMAHVADDGRGGHDVSLPKSATENITTTTTRARPNPGNFSGIWLSHYQYYSSGRQETLSTGHYVVILQHGDHLTVRSLSGSAPSSVSMELDLDGGVATGTWTEDTDPSGYYRGARYSGAIQLLVEPTGHRLVGKWIGYGKNFDINSGPWEFVLQDASTSKSAIAAYDHPPDFDQVKRLD